MFLFVSDVNLSSSLQMTLEYSLRSVFESPSKYGTLMPPPKFILFKFLNFLAILNILFTVSSNSSFLRISLPVWTWIPETISLPSCSILTNLDNLSSLIPNFESLWPTLILSFPPAYILGLILIDISLSL